jgi:hypothetical protein
VFVGDAAPATPDVELWYDPDAVPTNAFNSEVEVTDTEPTTEWELWVDTSALAPPPGATALAINDLTDVDTVTTAPAEGDGLGWSDTASNWVPQPVWGSWTGSQAEYDAIPTKNPAVLYAIV